MKNETFIDVTDDCLTVDECNRLIEIFEEVPNKTEGQVWTENGTELIHDRKKATELHRTSLTNTEEPFREMNAIILKGLNPCMQAYDEKYEALHYTGSWGIDCHFNFQKYSDETDGFKIWHNEHGLGNSSYRIMAWMIYLNDAECGTEFMNHETVNAKTGRCVIWPAGWTHVHRSVLPNVGIKYLVTGWVSLLP